MPAEMSRVPCSRIRCARNDSTPCKLVVVVVIAGKLISAQMLPIDKDTKEAPEKINEKPAHVASRIFSRRSTSNVGRIQNTDKET